MHFSLQMLYRFTEGDVRFYPLEDHNRLGYGDNRFLCYIIYAHRRCSYLCNRAVVDVQGRQFSQQGYLLCNRRKVPFYNTFTSWASYQIRKIAGCARAGNAGNVSPRRRFQRKPLVSDPGMHHGTCVTHVPWCMSGSLTCGDGENVPSIPGACAPAVLRIWQEAHCQSSCLLSPKCVAVNYNVSDATCPEISTPCTLAINDPTMEYIMFNKRVHSQCFTWVVLSELTEYHTRQVYNTIGDVRVAQISYQNGFYLAYEIDSWCNTGTGTQRINNEVFVVYMMTQSSKRLAVWEYGVEKSCPDNAFNIAFDTPACEMVDQYVVRSHFEVQYHSLLSFCSFQNLPETWSPDSECIDIIIQWHGHTIIPTVYWFP